MFFYIKNVKGGINLSEAKYTKEAAEKYVKDNLKVNFIFNTIDGAAYYLGMIFISFNTVFPVFLKKLGASNLLISFIPFITIAFTSIPQLLVAHYAKGLKRKKPIVLVFGTLQRLPWLFIGIGCLMFGSTSPKLLSIIAILMYIVFSIASGLAGPVWFDFFSKVTPLNIRGRLLSTRAIIGQSIGIPAALLVVAIIGRISFPYNYSILFFAAFFFTMISCSSLIFIREPEDNVVKNENSFYSFLKGIPQILKNNKDFRYFVISRAFFELSLSAQAFYSIYAIKHFSLSDSYAGIFTIITSISYILINYVLAWFGDKKGHKLNLLIGQIAFILSGLMAILSQNMFMIFMVFILSAISQSTKDLSINTITVEFCKSEERGLYLALSSLMMIPISIIVLAMGSIADLFGYSYLFSLAIFSTIISLALLYFKVRDPRKNRRHHKREQIVKSK